MSTHCGICFGQGHKEESCGNRRVMHPHTGRITVQGTQVYVTNYMGGNRTVGVCTSPQAAEAVARLLSDFQWPYSK